MVKHWNFVCKICNFFAPLSSERKSFNAVNLASDMNSSQIAYVAGAGALAAGTALHYSGSDILLFSAWPRMPTAKKQQVKLLHSKNLIPNKLQALLSQRSSLPNKQAFSKEWSGFLKKWITALAKTTSAKVRTNAQDPRQGDRLTKLWINQDSHPTQKKGLKRDIGALLLIQSLSSGRS